MTDFENIDWSGGIYFNKPVADLSQGYTPNNWFEFPLPKEFYINLTVGFDPDPNRRIIPSGIFNLTTDKILASDFKPPVKPQYNPPEVLERNWLNLNNVLDFRVGNSITNIDTELVTEFFIKYNYLGADKVYKFAIAPSTESYIGGPNQTPEVKAGILTRSSMAIKTFTLAGGEPIYQVLGLEPTMFSLTGLFIGAETNTSTSSTTSILTSNVYNPKANLTAVKSSELFDKEVVKSGRLIEVHLYSKTSGTDSEIKIKYSCLIQNARYFLRRSDRVYYALDLFLLKRL